MDNSLEEKNIVLLEQVYNELLLDKDNLEKLTFDNNNKIKEIDLYLESLFEQNDVDYEVFSPRSIQSIYKDRIEAQNNDKEKLMKENVILNSKINILSSRIKKLYTVLKSTNKFFENNIVNECMQDTFFENNDDYLCANKEEEKMNKLFDVLNMSKSTEVKTSDDDIKFIILDMQEKERQRIARDLHDNTVQNLTHLIHKIELSSKYIDQDVIRAKMELVDINRNIKSIINDMRNIIFYLRPMEFDDIGLKATFDKYFSEVQFQTKIQIVYDIEDININNQLVGISIFHIVKECVNNAIKYSDATTLNIIIKEENSNINIMIKDDGIGFDILKTNDKRHFGLSLTKENVSILKGKIDIKSIINEGTIITICIPSYDMKGVLND